jgi:hypothetical protein
VAMAPRGDHEESTTLTMSPQRQYTFLARSFDRAGGAALGNPLLAAVLTSAVVAHHECRPVHGSRWPTGVDAVRGPSARPPPTAADRVRSSRSETVASAQSSMATSIGVEAPQFGLDRLQFPHQFQYAHRAVLQLASHGLEPALFRDSAARQNGRSAGATTD